MPLAFDVVCLGGGVAAEAPAAGLRNTGLSLAVGTGGDRRPAVPRHGTLMDSRTVMTGRQELAATRAVVIANGSAATIPANTDACGTAGLPLLEGGWLKLDPETIDAHPGVFGAGDVTGLGGFTQVAHDHGQIVTRRLPGGDARGVHSAIPRVTYTDPGVVTPRAGELIGALVLAITLATPPARLADAIHPLPTFNRIPGAAPWGTRRTGRTPRSILEISPSTARTRRSR